MRRVSPARFERASPPLQGGVVAAGPRGVRLQHSGYRGKLWKNWSRPESPTVDAEVFHPWRRPSTRRPVRVVERSISSTRPGFSATESAAVRAPTATIVLTAATVATVRTVHRSARVDPARLELAASVLRGRRSAELSYGPRRDGYRSYLIAGPGFEPGSAGHEPAGIGQATQSRVDVAARIRTSAGPTPVVLSHAPLAAWVRRHAKAKTGNRLPAQWLACRHEDSNLGRTCANGPQPSPFGHLGMAAQYRGQDSNLRKPT